MTRDYNRHGTTSLFAALNIPDVEVIGRCIQKNTHHAFILFLNAVDRQLPVGKIVHAIMAQRRCIKHGVFKRITDRQAAINSYLDEHNENPKPLVWNRPAKDILAKINRLPVFSV
jgi:hypothetical protein